MRRSFDSRRRGRRRAVARRRRPRAAPHLGRRPRARAAAVRCSCRRRRSATSRTSRSSSRRRATTRLSGAPPALFRERCQQRSALLCSALLCSALLCSAALCCAGGRECVWCTRAARRRGAARGRGVRSHRGRLADSEPLQPTAAARNGTGPARRGARAAGWGRRDFIHSANPPCVPYLGVYLTDLTFIEDGIPDKIKHTTAAGDDGASAGRIAANPTQPNGRGRARETRPHPRTH